MGEILVFEHIPHKKILVTGPQRSGTTICARMIAHDTGFEYIDENRIGVDNLTLAKMLFESSENFVLQAPALSRWCHKLNADLVVFMMRAISDIEKSQRRIGWGCEAIELKKYGAHHGPIAQIKYNFWHSRQKAQVKNYLEANYNDLAGHKLFEHNRKHFSARQWRGEQ